MTLSIRAQHFRGLADEVLRLGQFTVLVGANGAGKSSILMAFDLISQLLDGQLTSGAWHSSLFDQVRGGFTQVGYGVNPEGTDSDVVAVIERFNPAFTSARVIVDPGGKPISRTVAGPSAGSETKPTDEREREEALFKRAVAPYRTTGVLNLNPASIARGDWPSAVDLRLAPDGSNLAAVLLDLKIRRPTAFEQVTETFRHTCPSVRDIEFERAMVPSVRRESRLHLGEVSSTEEHSRVPAYELRFLMENGARLSARQISDGTLFMLAVATAVWGTVNEDEQSFPILLLDGIETGLHPRAQAEVGNLLRRATVGHPKLRIIATTHSPYVVDSLDGSSVVVVTRGQDGLSRTKRLDSHPDYEKWKSAMNPGEFWSMVAEDWQQSASEK